MTRNLLALACVSAIALAACKQDPEEPTAPQSAAAEPVQNTGLIPTSVADENRFDQKGFAGTFSGTLPCADCPGIDAVLQLEPDGSYVLTETPRKAEGELLRLEGTWTAEADRRIRLDPDSKARPDRLYAIESNEEIHRLDADGEPAASGLDYRLRRAPVD